MLTCRSTRSRQLDPGQRSLVPREVLEAAGLEVLLVDTRQLGARAMDFEFFWDGLIRGTVLGSHGQPAFGIITGQYTGPETLPAGLFNCLDLN